MQAMYENQPEEGSTGLTDEEILGDRVGRRRDGIDDCVNEGQYAKYVTAKTAKTPVQPGAGGIGTPTVAVNGEVISNSTIPAVGEFASLFE